MVKNLKMAVKVLKDYYVKRKPKLMKDFSKEIGLFYFFNNNYSLIFENTWVNHSIASFKRI